MKNPQQDFVITIGQRHIRCRSIRYGSDWTARPLECPHGSGRRNKFGIKATGETLAASAAALSIALQSAIEVAG